MLDPRSSQAGTDPGRGRNFEVASYSHQIQTSGIFFRAIVPTQNMSIPGGQKKVPNLAQVFSRSLSRYEGDILQVN